MKKKLVFSVLLVCMLALSLVFAGCDTSTSSGGGGTQQQQQQQEQQQSNGGAIPDGYYVNASAGTGVYKSLSFYDFNGEKRLNLFTVTGSVLGGRHYTVSNGKVLTDDYSFNYTINGKALTVYGFIHLELDSSFSNYKIEGTYINQPY